MIFTGHSTASILWQFKFGFGYNRREVQEGDITLVYGSCAAASNFSHVVICIDHDPKQGLEYYLEDVRHLRNGTAVGLVHMGSEVCDDDWLKPILQQTTPFTVRFLFLVYGTSSAFDTTPPTLAQLPPIFHWPLCPAYVRRAPSIHRIVFTISLLRHRSAASRTTPI